MLMASNGALLCGDAAFRSAGTIFSPRRTQVSHRHASLDVFAPAFVSGSAAPVREWSYGRSSHVALALWGFGRNIINNVARSAARRRQNGHCPPSLRRDPVPRHRPGIERLPGDISPEPPHRTRLCRNGATAFLHRRFVDRLTCRRVPQSCTAMPQSVTPQQFPGRVCQDS